MPSKRQQRKLARKTRNALRAALAERDKWEAMYFARLRELERLRNEMSKLRERMPHHVEWRVTAAGLIVPD